MIFNLWPRVVVKLRDDERHVFDRAKLMFTEVQEIEKVTGSSFGEWQHELGRFSLGAIGALLHVLRKRDGMPSDYATLQFPANDLEVVPLHDDDTEYTPEEAAAELAKRIEDAARGNGAGPTPAAAALAAAPEVSPQVLTPTSGPSPNGSGSGPGNGSTSRTGSGSSAKRTSTRS